MSAENFRGVTFGHPITGSIASQLHGDGGEIVVHIDGSVDVPSLYEWSDQILLSRASGVLEYTTDIHVPYGGVMDEVYVEASSNLAGVLVDLPAPLAKPDRESIHQFRYRQAFTDSGYRVDLSMDEDLNASLKIDDGIVTGGRIHFGTEPFGAVTYDAIRMSGNLPFLSYEEWEAVTEELAQISDVSIEDEIATHVASVELGIAEFLVFSLPLDEVEMLITRGDSQWIAHLANEMLEGEVRIPDDDSAPLWIDLDRVSFESDGDAEDPFQTLDPTGITEVDFNTRQLLLDQEDFGQWSFNYRPGETGGTFENLRANALGLQVLEGSSVDWNYSEGVHSSRFSGEVLINDLAQAQQKFGIASSIEGTGIRITADVRWDGSPAMIDINGVTGAVNILEGKGRFVQADTGGALKLLGIFDFASLARRFRFDFSDVVEEGFEFSNIEGTTTFNKGVVVVQEPVVIYGSSGKFTVGGSANLLTRSLDNDMIVTLPVSRTLPWYAAYSAIATGPLAGAGVMLAQKVFENQINQMSSARYHISGTIEEPLIEFITIFDDKVREAPVE